MPEPAAPATWRDAVVPGALALLGALVVVALTLVHDHGEISRFVTAGRVFVAPRPHLAVTPGVGYDGQFVYRLALAPLDLARTAHGITLDTPLREQRIGLPVAGWLASFGGRPALVPTALVVVDVAALTAIGGLGGVAARQAGRVPAWGVLLAAVPGLAFALQRDLTEVLEIALLVAGLLALRAARPVAAGALLAGAALTRETALLAVAAVAVGCLRSRDRGRADLAWLLPVAAFAGWQLLVAGLTGTLPLHSDTGANLGVPVVGLVHALGDLPHATSRQVRLVVAQLVLLVYLLGAALPSLRRAPRPLPLAWLLTLLFSLSLSTLVWTGYDDLRFLLDLTELTVLVLLASRRRLGDVAVLTGAVWVLTLVLRVT